MSRQGLVLVIDDDALIRETLDLLLGAGGFQLAFAANGEEGLKSAALILPDVILLDISMPGLDGFEVCKRIRADRILQSIPVILLTALDDRQSRLNGLSAGADDFLTKPIDSLELSIRLKTLLRLNRYRRMKEERKRFEWVVERSNDGYVILDREGLVRYANTQARIYLNLLGDEVDTPFLEQASKEYRFEPTSENQQVHLENLPHFLVRRVFFGARAFWLQMERLENEESDGNILVRMRNVTEQMATYQDLRRFHTLVSHKLRTPLGAIYSSLELLSIELDELSKEDIQEFVRFSFEGAKRLLGTVNDILTYMDAPSSARGSSMLRDLESTVQRIAANLQIDQVNFSCQPDLLTGAIRLSPQAMEVITWELLENAKKFNPLGSPVVDVMVESGETGYTRLVFQDNGIHLSAEQVNWAWMPYFQGEKSFSGELAGMGLGFPTVATLVWQVGGKVSLTNFGRIAPECAFNYRSQSFSEEAVKIRTKSKILVVDDEPIARATIQALLGESNYEIFLAENGADGVRMAADVQPDVILLDVMMPNMDGFEACRKIRSMPDLAEVPILLLTALDDQRSKMTGLRSGADDFIVKPFNVLELQIRIQNMTRLNRYRMLLEQRHELERLHDELTIAYDRTIDGWSQAVDLRDRETEKHTERVTRMVLFLARAVRMSDEQIVHIRRGAILHDVGKLAVPDSILQKRGPLTPEEWVVMKGHTRLAYEWLNKIHYLQPAVDIPYCHHEKWDGSGYPRGLKGNEIPLAARLFAIVDVWDAMTSERPYHLAMSRDEVLAYVEAQREKHFDPAVVDLFLSTGLAFMNEEDLISLDPASTVRLP